MSMWESESVEEIASEREHRRARESKSVWERA